MSRVSAPTSNVNSPICPTGVTSAAVGKRNRAGERRVTGAGGGGAADRVVDREGGSGTATQGQAELAGGGRFARTGERDDLDVGQVAGIGNSDDTRADRTEPVGAAAAGGGVVGGGGASRLFFGDSERGVDGDVFSGGAASGEN